MTKNITIDFMTIEDIPFIMEIEKKCFDDSWAEDGFLRELENKKVAVYMVLRLDGVVRGYIGCWAILSEAHIIKIAIDPICQSKGLASLLLLKFMREAISRGSHWATLEVNENNAPAIKLYEKFGFTKVSVRKKYYNENEDAHLMWVGKLHYPDYSLKLDEIEHSLESAINL